MDDLTKAKKSQKAKYDIEYAKNNLKRVPLDMQKSDYEALKAMAVAKGERVNEYIKKAIWERIERDIDLGEFVVENPNVLYELTGIRPKNETGAGFDIQAGDGTANLR